MADETPKTPELGEKDLDAAVGGVVPQPPGPVPIPYPNTGSGSASEKAGRVGG